MPSSAARRMSMFDAIWLIASLNVAAVTASVPFKIGSWFEHGRSLCMSHSCSRKPG